MIKLKNIRAKEDQMCLYKLYPDKVKLLDPDKVKLCEACRGLNFICEDYISAPFER